MNYLDYIILALIIIGFILGFKDGLVRKIIGLAGIIAGIFLAVKFSDRFGQLLSPLMDYELYLSEIIAGIIIFLICIVAASIIKRVIHPHDKVNKFVNQFLGGITGIVQMVFFASFFFLVLSLFRFPSEETSKKSLLYSSVYGIVPGTIDFLIGGKDFVRDYIENKDKNAKIKSSDGTAKTNAKKKK